MKEFLKNILKGLGLYHPIHRIYWRMLHKRKQRRIQKAYESLRGYGFVCNNCGAAFKKFVPDHPKPENRDALERNYVIAGYGENVFCPDCFSTARERLVLGMFDHVEFYGKKILHFSPEKHLLHFFSNQTTPVTVDLFPEFYKEFDKNIQKADATHLTFPDESFDLVIGNHIMEHIPDDRKAMREIIRVLKKGGQAVLQIPFSNGIAATIEEPSINDPKRQSALFGQRDHVRIYLLGDYLDRLEETGFEVQYIPYEELSHLYKHAIQKGEGFIVIRKPE